MLLPLFTVVLLAPAEAPAKPSFKDLIESARTVRAAIVKAAEENHRLRPPARREGDQLTPYYVSAAATAARKLPPDRAGPAFLLALGVSLDTAALLRKNPVTGGTWQKVESDAEREARLKVIGLPALHGRHDLCQHFFVSCALTASNGAKQAEAAGLLKELLDANGGSGFSFADLAADLSGVSFAEKVIAEPKRLARLEKSFRAADFAVGPRGLIEGLPREEFEKRYGSLSDPRFREALDALKKRIGALPAFSAE
jgi:hypothetical protein